MNRTYFFKGFISLSFLTLLSILLGCMIILIDIGNLFVTHLKTSRDWVQAYAFSVSGLRLYRHFQDQVIFVNNYIDNVSPDDFNIAPEIYYHELKFKIIKNKTHVFSYGSYNEAISILKKRI
jgi:hypothetical protein